MLSSITSSTLRQYNVGLRKWWDFCFKQRIDVCDLDVPKIISFLTSEFKNGASYGSLNSIRSALALLISPNVGSNDNVQRFFKGVYNLRPGRPKYDTTWDPQEVLRVLEKMTNSDITIERLTKKLVMLLALSTGHRIQTLSLIKIDNIIKKSNAFEIKISDRIKTSGRQRTQPVLFVPYFKDKPQLCVASCLDSYRWVFGRTS
ncbi:uncharacterized protein LOC116165927 [Photinus pyralis]|uniref:uncharacterized protein LOC116165927 n=1 Tax=Photinus pyralis TaxID=7054 RepID=UPI001267698B|nr:uncharacterized protein LOC116165927 [Photinus pyralis]